MEDEVKKPNPYDLPAVPVGEDKQPYWLGVLPTAPRWFIAVGGLQFHRYTDPPVGHDVDSGATQRAFMKGSIEQLKPSRVQQILEAVKSKVVRFRGTSGTGDVYDINNRHYTRQAGDQPLAMHIYLVSYDERASLMRETPRTGYPRSIYEMAGGTEKPVVPKACGPQVAPGIEDLDKPAEAPSYGGRRLK